MYNGALPTPKMDQIQVPAVHSAIQAPSPDNIKQSSAQIHLRPKVETQKGEGRRASRQGQGRRVQALERKGQASKSNGCSSRQGGAAAGAGVPGSFYGRIFPTASIHFFNSAMALHWLSKAPVGASNKGRIHYYGGGPSVQAAYMTQFQADTRAFLESRAEELVEGGLLSLLLFCRKKIWGQISLPINFLLKLWSLYSKSLYLRGR